MVGLPSSTNLDLAANVRSYWLDRARQHTTDSYAGIPLSKFPEDLRTYEHLLWLDRPDTVIEIGTQWGGSALWFRDRLRTLETYGLVRDPRVITVDVEQTGARECLSQADREYAQTIHLIAADIRDTDTITQLQPLLGRRCLVIEDSAHEYDTTMAALTGLAHLVPAGGFFVVEDGCVDIEEMRLSDDWPRGVLPALHDWLTTSEGKQFVKRRDLELYGITCHPHGFLQRRPVAQ